jgi:hypothetical protein
VEIDHRENNWELAKELTVQTFEFRQMRCVGRFAW